MDFVKIGAVGRRRAGAKSWSGWGAVLVCVAGCAGTGGRTGTGPNEAGSTVELPRPSELNLADDRDQSLVTLADYLSTGEEKANRFLDEGKDDEGRQLSSVLERARNAVVRIRVNYGRTSTSYQTDHGTGFFIDGGSRVLTAGHVLAAFGTDPSAEAVLTCTDGRSLKAKPGKWEFSGRAGEGADIGTLEVVQGASSTDRPSLEMGTLRPGALVAILGYPGRMGRNAGGLVVGDDHVKNNPLVPLTFVGRVRQGGVIDPVAGCIPEGGMSGGPVIDSVGKVVAVQASVSRHQTGETLSYTIHSSPVGNIGR